MPPNHAVDVNEDPSMTPTLPVDVIDDAPMTPNLAVGVIDDPSMTPNLAFDVIDDLPMTTTLPLDVIDGSTDDSGRILALEPASNGREKQRMGSRSTGRIIAAVEAPGSEGGARRRPGEADRRVDDG